MTQDEFEILIDDQTKHIEQDIHWLEDEDHSPSLEFRADILSDAEHTLFIHGSYNPLAQKLTYALIHKAHGRIYALDMGQDHHNPEGDYTGEIHKHRWDEQVRDKRAYVPGDITAAAPNPVAV